MPAIVLNPNNRWPEHVPYVIDDCINNKIWLRGKILEFNTRVGRNVFVPQTDEPNYARFVPGADSPIGMQGNVQVLRCNENNLFHEMGHCVGLGHTYFHSGAQLRGLFEGVDLLAFNASAATYTDQGFADVDSMMAYSPPSFTTSPRIQRICILCQNNRHLLLNNAAPQRDLQTLIDLRGAPAVASFRAQFEAASRVPAVFRNRNHFKVAGRWTQISVSDYNALRSLDPDDLNQFKADIVIVRKYWKFDVGFMMRVSDDDVKAVRAVLRE